MIIFLISKATRRKFTQLPPTVSPVAPRAWATHQFSSCSDERTCFHPRLVYLLICPGFHCLLQGDAEEREELQVFPVSIQSWSVIWPKVSSSSASCTRTICPTHFSKTPQNGCLYSPSLLPLILTWTHPAQVYIMPLLSSCLFLPGDPCGTESKLSSQFS